MDENKKSFWKTCMFGYIPAGYFAVMLVLVIVGQIFGVNPPGFLGGFTVCSVFGLLLVKIGDNTPFVIWAAADSWQSLVQLSLLIWGFFQKARGRC